MISYRDYKRADLQACTQIGVDVFPLYKIRFSGDEVRKIMNAHIDNCYLISDYGELAIVDGVVAGILFGRIKPNITLIKFIKEFIAVSWRYIRGKYGSRKKLIRFLLPCIEEARILSKNIPPSECRVVLFAVAPKYQGKGIGYALMDRFTRYASSFGFKTFAVPTDETASFWFYERYGFKRWAEYRDPLLTYLALRSITSFTYQLVLQK